MSDEILAEDGGVHEERGRRWLWIIVLALLLLLLGCTLLQLLFPGARGTLGKPRDKGLTSVFSIYGLHKPLGVAAGRDGEIAVSDTGVQKVLLFDDVGRFVRRIGGDLPADRVFSVDGLTFSDGVLLVSDWSLRRVWVFGLDGGVKDYFPKDPTSAEYGEEGLTPYGVAEFGDSYLVSSRDGIYRFAKSDLKSRGRFDKPGEIGDPRYVNGIAADEDAGIVYACDTLNRRVIAYDESGRPLWTLGREDVGGEIVSFFGLPRGIAVVKDGVLVSDTFHHQLYLLSRKGELIGWYGQRGVTDAKLNFPEGLDVASDGLVYLADRENDRVQVVRLGEPLAPDGTMRGKWSKNHESFR